VSLHPSGRNENIEEALERYSCFCKQDYAGKEEDANKIDLDDLCVVADPCVARKEVRTPIAVSFLPSTLNLMFPICVSSPCNTELPMPGTEIAFREGEGSKVVFELKGNRKYLHRPHPGKEAKKYQIEELWEWFDKLEVRP
jgi:hypothetical protein